MIISQYQYRRSQLIPDFGRLWNLSKPLCVLVFRVIHYQFQQIPLTPDAELVVNVFEKQPRRHPKLRPNPEQGGNPHFVKTDIAVNPESAWEVLVQAALGLQ